MTVVRFVSSLVLLSSGYYTSQVNSFVIRPSSTTTTTTTTTTSQSTIIRQYAKSNEQQDESNLYRTDKIQRIRPAVSTNVVHPSNNNNGKDKTM